MTTSQTITRNSGMPLDLSLIESLRVNRPALNRRVSSLNARRSQKKEYQAAWLVRAIECMDLTTLSGDDTFDRVARLCAKAQNSILAALQANEIANLIPFTWSVGLLEYWSFQGKSHSITPLLHHLDLRYKSSK